jgi:hypothetical protein
MAGLVALKFDVKPVNVYSAHQEYGKSTFGRQSCFCPSALTALPRLNDLLAASTACAAASCPLERAPNSNFLRGVKWSPDGACLLTASDDGWWVP